MKKLFVMVCALVCAAAFSGCHKDPAARYFMSANINGVPFTATSVILYRSLVSGQNMVTITGANSDGRLNLHFKNLVATGTTPFSTDASGDFNEPSAFHKGLSGSVTVTSVSSSVAGTFYFTCTDSTKVTEGSFSTPAQ